MAFGLDPTLATLRRFVLPYLPFKSPGRLTRAGA